jgi:hypothetical protein
MNDFLYRSISEEAEVTDDDGNAVKVMAWRTRNSNGHQQIGVEFGKQRIEFNIGDDYEQHARLVIDLLDKVCGDPCELPNAPNA